MRTHPVYIAQESSFDINIDGNWSKEEWKSILPLVFVKSSGNSHNYLAKIKAKLRYHKDHLYLIFKVREQKIPCDCLNQEGGSHMHSHIRFLFAPNIPQTEQFFDFSIDCMGSPMIEYHNAETVSRLGRKELSKVKIAHSMHGRKADEDKKMSEWILECKIPFEILKKHLNEITIPGPGESWRADFIKSSFSSGQHDLSWAGGENTSEESFEQSFGLIQFQASL